MSKTLNISIETKQVSIYLDKISIYLNKISIYLDKISIYLDKISITYKYLDLSRFVSKVSICLDDLIKISTHLYLD